MFGRCGRDQRIVKVRTRKDRNCATHSAASFTFFPRPIRAPVNGTTGERPESSRSSHTFNSASPALTFSIHNHPHVLQDQIPYGILVFVGRTSNSRGPAAVVEINGEIGEK